YKTPVAHGFLTLSLAPKLMAEIYRVESVKIGVNYGANKIRFTNVVPVGSRLRMKAWLHHVELQNSNEESNGRSAVVRHSGAAAFCRERRWAAFAVFVNEGQRPRRRTLSCGILI
ncbi:MAG: hypothetical protein H7Z72_17755, partial [Bacteroidetes bacterium]|nr:hypothetical protein [Fibrella sp.]